MKEKLKLKLVVVLLFISLILAVYIISYQRPLISIEKSNDLQELSDDFTAFELNEKWLIFDPYDSLAYRTLSKLSNKEQTGYLEFQASKGGWFFSEIGPFIYQNVEGDFLVTTRVAVCGKSGDVPKYDWSLSGMMLRKPNDSDSKENWTYTMVGTGMSNKLVVDQKNTVNNKSEYSVYPVKDEWITLAMLRIGDFVTSAFKSDNSEWKLLNKYHRDDFPPILQVGFCNISDWEVANNSDVIGFYDYMKFNRIKVRDEFSDMLKLKDEEVDLLILRLLEEVE